MQKYRSLKPEKIVETIAILERRIYERFPNAGLRNVAEELHQIAQEAIVRAERIRRPNIPLRLGISLLVLLILGLLGSIATSVRMSDDLFRLDDFVQSLEALLGSLVFIGAAILFLASLEIRMKRSRALRAVHELRALAHIVDMHQLTKDPERITGRGPRTQSSPQRTMTTFELSRYLDYCSELLSLISKIGALYVQNFPDPVALAAVDQLSTLTNGLSRNVWQKLMILDMGSPETATTPPVDGVSTAAPNVAGQVAAVPAESQPLAVAEGLESGSPFIRPKGD